VEDLDARLDAGVLPVSRRRVTAGVRVVVQVSVVRRVSVVLIMSVLGYLLGTAIFNHSWDEVETENVDRAYLDLTTLLCESHGPITLRRHGFVSECRARAENRSRGSSTIVTACGSLKPHLIGDEGVEVFARGELAPEWPSTRVDRDLTPAVRGRLVVRVHLGHQVGRGASPSITRSFLVIH
jgi:hypothetical protein